MAENLRGLGMAVRLVQRGPQLFTSADMEMTELINAELARNDVDLSLGESVLEACEGVDGRLAHMHTSAGEVDADLLVLAIGVEPASGLARAAGARIGVAEAIGVDAAQRTSLPDIYAAGDCAEHYHRVLGRPSWIPLGTTANKQGRVAGRNMAGGDDHFAGIVGSAITRIFELGVGRTGLSEREAVDAGLRCVAVTLDSTDYAGYLPGAQKLSVKLVAERGSGRLLGGQLVGPSGVDKRVDVLATALYAGLTVEDLTRLDLEYAPPFNSVWDPIQAAATALLRRGL
jgi:NADPH-dependent 2,4-dienoyl-CoA reductase/sulfur reductase-like enzyme